MIAKREKIVAAHKREAQRIAKRGKVETAVKPARSVEHRTARLNARAMRLKQARADAKTQRDAEGKGSKEAMLATRVSRNRANELARQRAKDGNTTRHDEGRFLTARKRLHETKRSLQKEGANLKLRSKELTKERDRLSARVEQVRHHELHHSHAEKVYGRSLPKTASHQRALAGHARALERVREAEGRAAAKRVAFHERILEKRRLQLKATHARNGTNSDHLREMGIHV
ncbi:hypothetical protein [Caudoviricetes sp.]|nr:hypothetical protein [Caudoviricetes sp.]